MKDEVAKQMQNAPYRNEKNSVDLLRGGVRQVEELLQLVHEARDDLLNQDIYIFFRGLGHETDFKYLRKCANI